VTLLAACTLVTAVFALGAPVATVVTATIALAFRGGVPESEGGKHRHTRRAEGAQSIASVGSSREGFRRFIDADVFHVTISLLRDLAPTGILRWDADA
jgi:hypothetical protein